MAQSADGLVTPQSDVTRELGRESQKAALSSEPLAMQFIRGHEISFHVLQFIYS